MGSPNGVGDMLLAITFILSAASTPAVFAQDDPSHEYIDLLDLHKAYCDSISSFELTIESTVTDGIAGRDDDETLVSTSRGTLVVDKQAQRAQWCLKIRPVDADTDTYRLVEVRNDEAFVWHVNSRSHLQRKFDSYEQAFEQSGLPILDALGVAEIPSPSNFRASLDSLKVDLLDSQSSVSRQVNADEVKFTAKIPREGVAGNDIFTQRFSLSDSKPLGLTFARSINGGKPVVYFKNEVVWQEVQEILLPSYVFSSAARLRIENGKRLRGERKVDIQLLWNSVNREIEFLDTSQEPTLARIRTKFFSQK